MSNPVDELAALVEKLAEGQRTMATDLAFIASFLGVDLSIENRDVELSKREKYYAEINDLKRWKTKQEKELP